MRILLTGVSGQIGHALLAQLQTRGEIIRADRKLLDLTRPDLIPGVLDTLKPDLIVNPAAYTDVDRAETDSDLAFLVNATSPGVLARWATDNNVPMVHFSTDYVFDGTGERPWRENDLTRPLSVYGHSKLAGENAVRMAAGSHLIIRTSWIYASYGNSFLQKIIRRADDDEELCVVSDQIGAPTSARSIAEAVSHIVGGDGITIESRFKLLDGIVHIANSGSTSRHGFAIAILDGLVQRGIVPTAKPVASSISTDTPMTARRPLNSRLDLTRLENTLGLKMADWRTAISDELDLLKSDPRSSTAKRRPV